MIELKKMDDIELASHVLAYIERLNCLMELVSRFLNSNDFDLSPSIYDEYKRLKAEVGEDAHYASLLANSKGRSKHYYEVSRAISEAAAFGFMAKTNSRINQRFYGAIEETHYKLGKCNPQKILDDAKAKEI